MVVKITYSSLKRELTKILKDHPDEQQEECTYWNDGPSCLIGRAFFNLGVSEETLKKMDNMVTHLYPHLGSISLDVLTYDELLELGIKITDEALRLGIKYQYQNDEGTKWGLIEASIGAKSSF
jgi:hypothetical protein